MADTGQLLYDQDATYIELRDKHVVFSRREDIAIDPAAEEDEARRREAKLRAGAEESEEEKKKAAKAAAERAAMLERVSGAPEGEGEAMVRQLQASRDTLDKQMAGECASAPPHTDAR